MRAWFVGGLCGLPLACGGNVVVDPAARGTGASPTTSSSSAMNNGGSTPVIVGGDGGGFTGMACDGPCNATCADSLANGGYLCAHAGQASDDHAKLMECVAMTCAVPCSSFISGCPLANPCFSCAVSNCESLLEACTNE
jgi:hypothetical protein